MCRRMFLLVLLAWISVLSACAAPVPETGPKREAFKYIEKRYEVDAPLELSLKMDAGNIEVYSWDKSQVKFEIKNRVIGIGEKAELEKKLEYFRVEEVQAGNRIDFEGKYKKSTVEGIDASTELRLFLPKKTRYIYCKLDRGAIRFLDDIEADLDMEVKRVNTDIKRLKGKLVLKGESGNLKLENGRLKKESQISLALGNIEIRAQHEEGNYQYDTNRGNIDLQLPEDSKVSFENMGAVEENQFSQGFYPTLIRNSTRMGRITLRKY